MRLLLKGIVIALTFPAVCGVTHDADSNPPAPSTRMSAGAMSIAPPAGFISFCLRFWDQCGPPKKPGNTMILTNQSWALLNRTNARINGAIVAESDLGHFGRAEYWTIPTDGRGNCHDYALAKRQALINGGVPELALRVAIVETPGGERHAVLTVVTDRGDYVLDNLQSDIRPWSDTDYKWLERQAATNAMNWNALDGRRNPPRPAPRGAAPSPRSFDR